MSDFESRNNLTSKEFKEYGDGFSGLGVFLGAIAALIVGVVKIVEVTKKSKDD